MVPRRPRPVQSIQGGQPQRVLMSQGEVRPGVVQGQHWAWRTWWELAPLDRLPYVRSSPDRCPDHRLSHPVVR